MRSVVCRHCATPLRRTTGLPLCRPCLAIRDRYVDREYAGVEPDAWVRACNQFSSVEMAMLAIREEMTVAV